MGDLAKTVELVQSSWKTVVGAVSLAILVVQPLGTHKKKIGAEY